MKRKIIQICGGNGTGKTTLIKRLLESGPFYNSKLQIAGKTKEYWCDGDIAVIGKYNENRCCGLDSENYSIKDLLASINTVISQQNPLVILFEDMRLGSTYPCKEKLRMVANNAGYEYCVITLIADLTLIAKRIVERSGNENVDFDARRMLQKQCIRSSRKIEANGAKSYIVDTGRNTLDMTFSILKGIINE